MGNGNRPTPEFRREAVLKQERDNLKESRGLLRERGILISMSGRGNCYDNSMVLRRENSPLDCFLNPLPYFKTIKSDLSWPFSGELIHWINS